MCVRPTGPVVLCVRLVVTLLSCLVSSMVVWLRTVVCLRAVNGVRCTVARVILMVVLMLVVSKDGTRVTIVLLNGE